ncbi:YlzJ-like family protein [Pelosinus sp. sgz500959]|uniref:YlzJ-like family protein n=1 Tax=Pelosinus sp. sgz500959 TaxID=3242472 RepID=UPI00366A7DAA
MILWSIVDPDLVLSDLTVQPVYEEAEYNGMKCVVEKVGSAQCRIIKLLTTDPSDYLRSELQPGTMLAYEPILKKLS